MLRSRKWLSYFLDRIDRIIENRINQRNSKADCPFTVSSGNREQQKQILQNPVNPVKINKIRQDWQDK